MGDTVERLEDAGGVACAAGTRFGEVRDGVELWLWL